MIQLNTNFNPFRMKLGRRDPVTLTVEITNKSDESKMLTVYINLGRELSFEKSGYKTEAIERIDAMKPGEIKTYYYSIFPKAGTRTEAQPVLVKVQEHYKTQTYVANEYSKNLKLKVEE